jgi:hypothetical protein
VSRFNIERIFGGTTLDIQFMRVLEFVDVTLFGGDALRCAHAGG